MNAFEIRLCYAISLFKRFHNCNSLLADDLITVSLIDLYTFWYQWRSLNFNFGGPILKWRARAIFYLGYMSILNVRISSVCAARGSWIAARLYCMSTRARAAQVLPEEYTDWFNYIIYILFIFSLYLLWLSSRSCSQYNDIQSLNAITENITRLRWWNVFLTIVYGLEMFL